MEKFEKNLKDLESRVKALEERMRDHFWVGGSNKAEEDLVGRYGEYVDKTATAKILGVTRATVCAMLEDGRIEAAHGGRKVSVRSVARYIASPKPRSNRIKCGIWRKEAQNGTDTLEEA